MRTTIGDIALAKNVVIYLIYPSDFVKKSHIHALEYFISKGFSPIVVSNLYLTLAEKEALAPYCVSIIERINFGYDFGGYRDGILSIRQSLPELDRLVIMNDSVWLTPTDDSDWIDQVTALNVDFAGASTDQGLPKERPADFEQQAWTYTTTHKGFHYGSFAICVGERVVRDPGFLKFWQKYPLTNDKALTIERGEKGLTQWAIRNGYSHEATADMAQLYTEIQKLDHAETFATLSDLIVPFEPGRRDLKRDLLRADDGSEEWVRKAKLFILSSVAAQGFSYTLPGFAQRTIGFPFIKKSPVWLASETSDCMLHIAQNLGSSHGKVIANEMKEIRASELLLSE